MENKKHSKISKAKIIKQSVAHELPHKSKENKDYKMTYDQPISDNNEEDDFLKNQIISSNTAESNEMFSNRSKKMKKKYSMGNNESPRVNKCGCCNKEMAMDNVNNFILKCGHCFCRNCLVTYFSSEEGIKCPVDGFVGKSINELQLYGKNKKEDNREKENINLENIENEENINNNDNMNNMNNNDNINDANSMSNNMSNNMIEQNISEINKNANNPNVIEINNDHFEKIVPKKEIKNKRKQQEYSNRESENNENNENNNENNNNNIDNDNNNDEESFEELFCRIHPKQRISHFVEETRELICVYCAFNKIKANSHLQIKEIPEKCKEYIQEIDSVLENNQRYAQILQSSLNEINQNKDMEQKKIEEIYDQLINFLIAQKNSMILKLNEYYNDNIKAINNKLEYFADHIETFEKFKEDFYTVSENIPIEFNHILDSYNSILRDMIDREKYDLSLTVYNFAHDDQNKVMKYLNNFADLKYKKKFLRFDDFKKNNRINYESNNNIGNNIGNNMGNNMGNNIPNNAIDANNMINNDSHYPTVNNENNMGNTIKLFKEFEFNTNNNENTNTNTNNNTNNNNYNNNTYTAKNNNIFLTYDANDKTTPSNNTNKRNDKLYNDKQNRSSYSALELLNKYIIPKKK